MGWVNFPARPATSPALYLARRKADGPGSILVRHAWLFVKEQHEATTLGDLNRNRPPSNALACILQEIVREITKSGQWTWHSGFLSSPGLFFGFTSLYQRSIPTTTLIVKRTT